MNDRPVRFFESNRPLVFAHRGGCDIGPENTLAAFDRGLAAGADGIELDVHLAADGRVVVHHDETLERTTNGSGPIAARTSAELSRLDASCRFVPPAAALHEGSSPPSGFDPALIGVPTLQQVLNRYRDTRIIVEMKVDSEAMGLAVAADIRAAGAVERVCAAGFGARSLRAVRRSLPEVATSACALEVRVALYRSWALWPVRHVRYEGYQVPEYAGRLRIVSRRFVDAARRAGLGVQVWTVDEQAEMERLLGWGVGGLISNRPHVAVRVRDAYCRQTMPALS